MSDYDFKSLNDKEFEILCADLIGEVEGIRIERFKAGRDAGVDGRFFISESKEVILQCKHWSTTPLNQLISALKLKEKPKLDKLKPHRYLLAISKPLSRVDKQLICSILAPHIKSESDIYGKEDLNDLIQKNGHIEERHYKLWLHSSRILGRIANNAILGRSSFSLEEIIRASSRYVVTANHQAALNTLEKLGVVIITGEPGVGKTTLADHLCLHYVGLGFNYLKIADDIKEAESVFDPHIKQIIYFDDFLGRNYLDALRGHEGSHITQFIRRVTTNKNKRFVLTSRSTILNQGKLLIDALEHNNIKRNEYEIKIKSLTDLDKAQILYNHIWHSNLDNSYIEEIYLEQRYRQIIKHKNFNPRLISLITDATRLNTFDASRYWEYIVDSLTNPSQVWENPFVAQNDDFARAIIFLVVLNGYAIDESILAEAYYRFTALAENRHLQGRQEFQTNIQLLTGSFLNRAISSGGPSSIDLFNPSVGDYVLRRYSGNVVALRLGLQSLRTIRSTTTLASLVGDGLLSMIDAKSICKDLFEYFFACNFEAISTSYISALFTVYKKCEGLKDAPCPACHAAAIFVLNSCIANATSDSFEVIAWGLEQEIITPEQAVEFVFANIQYAESAGEIKAISSLLSAIPSDTPKYYECSETVKSYVLGLVSDNLSSFIDVDYAFSKVQYGEYDDASNELEKLIEKELDELGIEFSSADVSDVLSYFDVDGELNSYFESFYHGGDDRIGGPARLSVDEIEDLFDRG